MEGLIPKTWVRDVSELHRCLDADLDVCTTCRGHSKNKPTCGNRINKDSRSKITPLLLKIFDSGSITCAIDDLKTLASLVLCRRYHQIQIAEKVAQWKSRLVSFLGLNQDAASLKAAQSSSSSDKASHQIHRIRMKIFKPTTTIQQPTSSLAETKPEKASLANSLVKQEQDNQHIKTEAIPFAANLLGDTVECKDTIHNFVPYLDRPKSIEMINKDIVNKLNKPFMKSEREGCTKGEGYIYGYQLPEDHKTTKLKACQVVKIGYTNDYNRRMEEWQDQCHYEPQLVFAYKVMHHVKMEKIIHILLSNYQRKDKCPGCSVQHREFFEVNASTAEAIVRMWAVWARLRPFDDEGRLSAYWSRKLKEINTEDPDCWEKLVFDKVK